MDRFSTDDELKYVTKECLKEQSRLSILQALKNWDIAINCTLTQAVNMLENLKNFTYYY